MKQKTIDITVKDADGNVTADFTFTYEHEAALKEALHRIVPVALTHGQMVCTSLVFPFALNDVSFQQTK